ncbi:MAG: glycosyl transferase, group 1 [Polaromonas sp.]|jgi:glycosyltransferase involved in cell wall biosynthesis|nr:glycosyl transferase, group 1 [Polaromonas sp.]
MLSEPISSTAPVETAGQYIYIACPWTPKGGGMFKIADYLIQAQSFSGSTKFAELRPLDTRGDSNPLYSLLVLVTAMVRLVKGRMGGKLAGVHVNMAERLSLFRKSVIVVTCKVLGIPVVLHLHAAQLHHFYRSLPRPLRAVTRWVFSLPSSCVVLGTAAQRFVIDELKVPASRVEIVINGVPEPVERLRFPSEPGIRRVLFVGNLSERKGVSDLLQAVAVSGLDRAQLQVTFAGGGDVEAYQNKANGLGLEGCVVFEGWSDQKKVADLMARSDVLVLPSYDEGLPLVILEALANRLAVICTPVGEIPSVFTDGVDALFVRPGDITGIADGLRKVLEDTTLRQTIASNGRALFETRFSLTHFFASVARVHQQHFGIAGSPQVRPASHSTEKELV